MKNAYSFPVHILAVLTLFGGGCGRRESGPPSNDERVADQKISLHPNAVQSSKPEGDKWDKSWTNWNPTKPLQWGHFQGVVPVDASSDLNAEVCAGVAYYCTTVQKRGAEINTFSAYSYVDRSRSWVRDGQQTPEILRHEQTHFDIAEFFARDLLSELNRYRDRSVTDSSLDSVFSRHSEQRSDLQHMYDEQTNHGANTENQAEWDSYVADLLANNRTYAEALKRVPHGGLKQRDPAVLRDSQGKD